MTDEQFCIAILPKVSRTFALSIEALPEPMRRAIRTAYLLCRIVDTVEDDPDLDPERRRELFATFQHLVETDEAPEAALEEAYREGPAGRDNSEGPLMRRSSAVWREFRRLDSPLAEAARPHILEMARGMADYAGRANDRGLTVLQNQEDLERYCYYVAGTVGNLLTGVFLQVRGDIPEARRKALQERSVAFGLGLQLTNIARDVAGDHRRGWCFLPMSWCAEQGVRPADLLSPEHRAKAMAVIGMAVDLAEAKLAEALEYTLLIPPTAPAVRLFVLVPLVLSLATLTLVRRSPDVLQPGHSVKVSRRLVAEALGRAADAVGDDGEIRALCRQATRLEL